MTHEEMLKLENKTEVRNLLTQEHYTVVDNHGTGIVVVRVLYITDPEEWEEITDEP